MKRSFFAARVFVMAILLAAFFGDAATRAQTAAPNVTPDATELADIKVRLATATARLAEASRMLQDWANLARYREANAKLVAPAAGEKRVVFMGDSITDMWAESRFGGFFPGKPYVDRGISGQTTPQMLIRFRQDVIDLKPKVVVILAGTNDIAENTGKETLEEIGDNIASMSELARANGIRVVLCSVLPASDFHWHPGLEPAPKIRELNEWIKQYAAKNGIVYVDYYSSLANSDGGLKAEFSPDGVHPNKAAYDVMGPLAEAGIAEALRKPAP